MKHNFVHTVARSTVPLVLSLTSAIAAHAADGFFVHPSLGAWHQIQIATEPTEIQRMFVPAGSYIANATAQLTTTSVTPVAVQCIFMVGGRIRGESAGGMVGGTGTGQIVSIPLTIGFTTGEGRKLSVACLTEHLAFVFSQPSPITAIRVDNLKIRKGLGFE